MPDGVAHLLERFLDQRVTLLLKDQRELAGTLVGIDDHMNVVLDDATETTESVSRHLGRVVLRGSNVVTLNGPAPGPGHAR
ncbi:MAG TPA: LSM domain-containing protein [Thermoplasmata archaeon]|nr:LSM domain-containing protein [Thermoplasmata archaeon]